MSIIKIKNKHRRIKERKERKKKKEIKQTLKLLLCFYSQVIKKDRKKLTFLDRICIKLIEKKKID